MRRVEPRVDLSVDLSVDCRVDTSVDTSVDPRIGTSVDPRVATAAASLLLVLLLLLLAPPARAGLPGSLLGKSPSDTARVIPTAGQSLDTLDVGRNADRALIHPGDQVAGFPGGDQVRTGVPGIVRPWLVGGPGYGRLPLVLDGFPIGQGVVHWDNPAWFPVRGIDHFKLAGGAGALLGDGSAGRALAASTFPGPVRPISVVSLLGGSFGHRLAELDFARQFGPVGFHADVADYGHDGFGPVGRTDAGRAFARLDFPMFGFGTTLRLGLASEEMEAGGGGLDSGTESTDESSFSLRLAKDAWEMRLLFESSRLEIVSTNAESFELTRDRWWGEAARAWHGANTEWKLSAFGSLESRQGVLDEDASFGAAGLGLGVARPVFDGGAIEGRLRFLTAEPTGVDMEGGVSLHDAPPLEAGAPSLEADAPSSDADRERNWWVEASRSRLVPALLLHQDAPLADRDRTAEILERIESLDQAEGTWRLALGAGTGGSFRVGVEVGALRAEDRLPWLSVAPGAPLGAATDEWIGEARLAVRWRPSTTIDFGLAAGGATFHAADEPFRPRVTADGWARLTRSYFRHDLAISGELRGHLVGERSNPAGDIYPTLLSADGILTAEVRTLTLFLRFDNLTDLFLESDWRDPDFPYALPGVSTRLGATLRLYD